MRSRLKPRRKPAARVPLASYPMPVRAEIAAQRMAELRCDLATNVRELVRKNAAPDHVIQKAKRDFSHSCHQLDAAIARLGARVKKPVRRQEQDFQIALVRLLRTALLPGAMVFHVPNGGKRTKVEAGILKAMGVKAGFPDLGLVHLGRLFCMELKRRDGGALSKTQKDCHEELRAAGVPVAAVRTVDDALRALAAWNIPTRIIGASA